MPARTEPPKRKAAIFCDKRHEESGNAGYSHLYRIADACISTSVLEGFGYGLREPWLYGRAVLGRLPCGPRATKFPAARGFTNGFSSPRNGSTSKRSNVAIGSG